MSTARTCAESQSHGAARSRIVVASCVSRAVHGAHRAHDGAHGSGVNFCWLYHASASVGALLVLCTTQCAIPGAQHVAQPGSSGDVHAAAAAAAEAPAPTLAMLPPALCEPSAAADAANVRSIPNTQTHAKARIMSDKVNSKMLK